MTPEGTSAVIGALLALIGTLVVALIQYRSSRDKAEVRKDATAAKSSADLVGAAFLAQQSLIDQLGRQLGETERRMFERELAYKAELTELHRRVEACDVERAEDQKRIERLEAVLVRNGIVSDG